MSFEKVWTAVVNSKDLSFVISIVSLGLTCYSFYVVKKVEKAVLEAKNKMLLKSDFKEICERLSNARDCISKTDNPKDIQQYYSNILPAISDCMQRGTSDKKISSQLDEICDLFTELEKGEQQITVFELKKLCIDAITAIINKIETEV